MRRAGTEEDSYTWIHIRFGSIKKEFKNTELRNMLPLKPTFYVKHDNIPETYNMHY